jgi:hypothetical protein
MHHAYSAAEKSVVGDAPIPFEIYFDDLPKHACRNNRHIETLSSLETLRERDDDRLFTTSLNPGNH